MYAACGGTYAAVNLLQTVVMTGSWETNMITVSLCMIVKNEEKILARCLDSLVGLGRQRQADL